MKKNNLSKIFNFAIAFTLVLLFLFIPFYNSDITRWSEGVENIHSLSHEYHNEERSLSETLTPTTDPSVKQININISSSEDDVKKSSSSSIYAHTSGNGNELTYKKESVEKVELVSAYYHFEVTENDWINDDEKYDSYTMNLNKTLSTSKGTYTMYHESDCFNKITDMNYWYDDDGYIWVEELDRNTDFQSSSNIQSCQFSGIGNGSKLKVELEDSEYTFKVYYKDIYETNLDNFDDESNEKNTSKKLYSDNKSFYTYGEYNYERMERIIRENVVSNYTNVSPTNPLTNDLNVIFYTDDSYNTQLDISGGSLLDSNNLYVKFKDAGTNDLVYGTSSGVNYKIPYIEGSQVLDGLSAGFNAYTSFNNPSAYKVYGNLPYNNYEVYLNTGGEIKIKGDREKNVGTNLLSVWYSEDGSGNYKEVVPENNIYSIQISELGHSRIKLVFYDDIWQKGENPSKGDSLNELVIDIYNKDGQTFFDNNDIEDNAGNDIEHKYGIYNDQLFEYYASPDFFRMDTGNTNSNYLFSEDFLLKETVKETNPDGSQHDVKYLGTLYKYDPVTEEWIDVTDGTLIRETGNTISFGEDTSGTSSLYKYELKDVFYKDEIDGVPNLSNYYKYDYYFETYASGTSSFGIEDYFKTEEGIVLLDYIMYNYPEVTSLEYISSRYNYKEVEEHRSITIGKKNIRDYNPSVDEEDNTMISIVKKLGKVEYGTPLKEIKLKLSLLIKEDIIASGYDPGSFKVEITTPDETPLIDSTRIEVKLSGVIGSSTYGESVIYISPHIVRNLSKLKIDNELLQYVTYRRYQDDSFSKDIQPGLEASLYNQMRGVRPSDTGFYGDESIDLSENAYFNIYENVDNNFDGVDDIKFTWTLPPKTNDNIKYGQRVEYKITSTNDDYFINDIEGYFISQTRYKLKEMWISDFMLQKETIVFEDEILFTDMQQKLEENLLTQIDYKLLNRNQFDISWTVNGIDVNEETIVNTEDVIGYKIFPKNSTGRFDGMKEGEIISEQYISLSNINIDVMPLQKILNNSFANDEFSIVRPLLESEIRNQITEQIGNNYSKYIDINWKIGDDELVYPGKVVAFTLTSNAPIKIHDSDNLYKIQYDQATYIPMDDNHPWVNVLIASIAILFILLIMYTIIKR